MIVTKEISRFSRNTVDSIKYTEYLLKQGVIVYFLSDNLNTIGEDSEFRLTIMSSLAQDEVRKLSERVKFGVNRMIKDRKLIGGNLTGYFKKNGKYEINPAEAPIIKCLFETYASGKFGLKKIGQDLAKMDFYVPIVTPSNPGFVVLGQRLGKETLFAYIDKFGFGKKTGIDLNGESSGIIFDLNKVGPLELATTSFGQGVSVTAIQQVQLLSTVVNNGTMMQPYIVKSINDADSNKIIKSVEPTVKKEKVINEKTSETVKYALKSVVANGSGRNAYVEGFKIGGKTGTAQKVGSDGRYMAGNYILSFIGFIEAEEEEYVVYIAVDNARNTVQYGGTVAGPIAHNIFETIINLYKIKATADVLPREYLWYETKYITVPDVVGLSKKEASKKLSGFIVEYSYKGNNVIEMMPKAGTRVKENSIVRLFLSD